MFEKVILLGLFAAVFLTGCAKTEQILPVEEAYNMRDLGGYEAADDKYVKKGLVYRSDELNRLIDKDLKYIAKLNIHTYVDA